MTLQHARPQRIKVPTRPRWQSKYHGVRMTPEQYLQLPEEKPYLEYVDGVVLQKPLPTFDHSELALEVGSYLRDYARQHGGHAGVEARTRLGELPHFRLPDVSYWKRGLPREDDILPTLAVEIRSPNQLMAELRTKCEAFRKSGVEVCWLIDPVSRTAELFEGRRKGAVIDTLKAECLPGFELPLGELFAVLDA